MCDIWDDHANTRELFTTCSTPIPLDFWISAFFTLSHCALSIEFRDTAWCTVWNMFTRLSCTCSCSGASNPPSMGSPVARAVSKRPHVSLTAPIAPMIVPHIPCVSQMNLSTFLNHAEDLDGLVQSYRFRY